MYDPNVETGARQPWLPFASFLVGSVYQQPLNLAELLAVNCYHPSKTGHRRQHSYS